jgi:hypothetical protein
VLSSSFRKLLELQPQRAGISKPPPEQMRLSEGSLLSGRVKFGRADGYLSKSSLIIPSKGSTLNEKFLFFEVVPRISTELASRHKAFMKIDIACYLEGRQDDEQTPNT